MKTINLASAGLIFLVAMPLQAALTQDGVWTVEEGDTIEGVLQKAFPHQTLRQQRVQRLAQRLSPNAFDEQGQLVVGQSLRLPGARMPEAAPAQDAVANSNKVGRVIVATGKSTAVSENGSERELKRGDVVYKGDTLKTEKSRAQVRFSDGSLLALRPDTQFKVEEYNYQGEQNGEERGFFSLIKGGFRTISGAIGQFNKQNYRVKTAVATIGIRGTHYGLTI